MARKKSQDKTAGGKPITDDLIDELAKKAEGGYDVDGTLACRRAHEATSPVIRRRFASVCKLADERCDR
jgi:hypothetical protein